MPERLFEILDLNRDGELSRSEIHKAAKGLGWHWREAPIFALFDLLTILKPISKDSFLSCIRQVKEDPLGPYGKVLLNSPHFLPVSAPRSELRLSGVGKVVRNQTKKHRNGIAPNDTSSGDVASLLKHTAGIDISNNYRRMLTALDTIQISNHDAAMLIIDPQRSFTTGIWMQSIGIKAEVEVKPIFLAFSNCSKFLKKHYGQMEIMFTRCPFPPESYDWDDRVAEIIDSTQLYFIKPGNSVWFPPYNGFKEWVERCIRNGKKAIVIGGCTLNSCVRVSSIETQARYNHKQVQVVVDLSLSGARMSNYIPSPLFGGLSAAESAVRQMKEASVHVVRGVEWNSEGGWSDECTNY
jgi:hypothetical protein